MKSFHVATVRGLIAALTKLPADQRVTVCVDVPQPDGTSHSYSARLDALTTCEGVDAVFLSGSLCANDSTPPPEAA